MHPEINDKFNELNERLDSGNTNNLKRFEALHSEINSLRYWGIYTFFDPEKKKERGIATLIWGIILIASSYYFYPSGSIMNKTFSTLTFNQIVDASWNILISTINFIWGLLVLYSTKWV